jgi:signal transduction histidine kinase
MSSIRSRIAFSFAVFSAATLLVGFTAYYLEARDGLMEVTDAELWARVKSVAALVERDKDESALPTSLRRAEALSSSRPLRGFLVVDARRSVVSESLENRPEVVDRLRTVERLDRAVTIHVCGSDLRVAHVRGSGGKPGFDAYVVEDLARVYAELSETALALAFAVIPAALLAIVCARFVARRIAGPVEAIADASDRMDVADYDVQIPQGGPDEVARLAATLQRTLDRLRDALVRERRFTSDASHELRTPLAAILVDAEIALRKVRGAENYQATLENVVRSGRRMHATLDALLFLASFEPESVHGARADVDDALHDAAAAVAPQAKERGATLTLPSATGLVAAADSALLTTAIRNILANAVEHGRGNGRVEARVRREDGFVVVQIEDDGPGIPSALLPHVFDPFVRGDPSRSTGGAGLGLSIVKRIVEAFDGTVALGPGPEGGTRAVVRLRAIG